MLDLQPLSDGLREAHVVGHFSQDVANLPAKPDFTAHLGRQPLGEVERREKHGRVQFRGSAAVSLLTLAIVQHSLQERKSARHHGSSPFHPPRAISPTQGRAGIVAVPNGATLLPFALLRCPVASVDETMLKVQRILTGPLNLSVSVTKDRFVIRFDDSSTTVMMNVREWGVDSEGEPQSLVIISSPILLEVPTSADLFEWVARNGGSRWFGHVEVHEVEESNTVNLIMSHTLLGDFLDAKELEAAMYTVLAAADGWDDELKARFGGRRLIES